VGRSERWRRYTPSWFYHWLIEVSWQAYGGRSGGVGGGGGGGGDVVTRAEREWVRDSEWERAGLSRRRRVSWTADRYHRRRGLFARFAVSVCRSVRIYRIYYNIHVCVRIGGLIRKREKKKITRCVIKIYQHSVINDPHLSSAG